MHDTLQQCSRRDIVFPGTRAPAPWTARPPRRAQPRPGAGRLGASRSLAGKQDEGLGAVALDMPLEQLAALQFFWAQQPFLERAAAAEVVRWAAGSA